LSHNIRLLAENISLRFKNELVIKDFTYSFETQSKTAIVGNNGSGKSTLLLALTGIMQCNKGSISYVNNAQNIEQDNWFRYYSLCAPSLELINEMNINELFQFHSKLKPMGISSQEEFLTILEMNNLKNKTIGQMSSGMKQKIKLALAILSNCPLLFLDEPTTNLDASATEWYKNMITTFCKEKSVLVFSNNQAQETYFCTNTIDINNYKK
jgi:ABC-type multidrug transport system ATPase subunit